MAYDVQTNIPLTPAENIGHGNLKYPWDQMEHGHSFFEPIEDPDNPKKTYRRVVNSGKAWLSRHKEDHSLVCRRRTEDGVDGFRFWMKKDGHELPKLDS